MKVKTKRNKWIMGVAEGLLLLSLLVASPSAVAQPTTGPTPSKEVATASADSSEVLAADSLSADSTLLQEIDSVSMAAELEAGEQTLRFTITGASCTIDKVELILTESTGIADLQVPIKPDEDIIYNVAGQKVDANYKGIVIKNGRKMLRR